MTAAARDAGTLRPRAPALARFDGPIALAIVLPLVASVGQHRFGLDLWDEGFLWYGAQRVLAGEVPLRDFQSYDIARYYWSAAWMAMSSGWGVLPIRLGNAVLATGAVLIATLAVRSAARRVDAWTLLAIPVFVLWMVPDFKVADGFATMLLIGGLAFAIARATSGAWAVFGVCLGVAATIGINHALYGVMGGGLAMAVLAWTGRPVTPRSVAALALGALVGYAPVIAMLLFTPGFGAAFADSIRQLFEAGSTNVTRPIPALDDLMRGVRQPLLNTTRNGFMAVLFLVAPPFAIACLWRLVRREPAPVASQHPAFTAAAILAIPYAHYALSRADFVHIAISVLPLLVAAWTYPVRRVGAMRSIALVAIAVATIVLALPEQRIFDALRGRTVEPFVLADETLWVTARKAEDLRLLQRLVDTQAPAGRPFYAAPYWPGAYAMARRRSPTWEIYLLFPSTRERQLAEIERLAAARIAFAVVSNERVDERDDLGFARTHPLIAAHLRHCYAPRDVAEDRALDVRVFVAAASTPDCPTGR